MASAITPICMIVFSYYPEDTRVRREAEGLAEAGMPVDVICLRNRHELPEEMVDGVQVYRQALQRRRAGKLRYLWEYFYFILLAFAKVSILHLRKHYKAVHVHNMPDVLIFSALIPRLLGAKVILDLHDPMPEAFMAKYSLEESHPVIRALGFLEKCSIRFAHLVLTPNIAFRDLFIFRGCPPQKIEVIMNSAQERFFRMEPTEAGRDERAVREGFAVMCHGTIAERYGLGEALEAIASVRNRIPGLVFHVYGEGDFVDQFLKRVAELSLEDIVHYYGLVPPEVIASAIKSIDVGLIPNEHSKHWDLAVPTRVFEYLSLGTPVMAPRTRGILDYFDEGSLHFFESGNVQSMAATILDVYRHPARVQAVLTRGMAINERYRWEIQKRKLVELVAGLVGVKTLASVSGRPTPPADVVNPP